MANLTKTTGGKSAGEESTSNIKTRMEAIGYALRGGFCGQKLEQNPLEV